MFCFCKPVLALEQPSEIKEEIQMEAKKGEEVKGSRMSKEE